MSQTTINCPQCKTSFPVEVPTGELHNGEQASVFIVAHHFTDDCPRCGRKFAVGITKVAAEYGWTEVKPKNMIIPGSIPVPRLT